MNITIHPASALTGGLPKPECWSEGFVNTILTKNLETITNTCSKIKELEQVEGENSCLHVSIAKKDRDKIKMLEKLTGSFFTREIGEFADSCSVVRQRGHIDALLTHHKAGANDRLRLKNGSIKPAAYTGYNPLKRCFGVGSAERKEQAEALSVLLNKPGEKITRTNLDPGAVLNAISNKHADQLLAKSIPKLPDHLKLDMEKSSNSVAKVRKMDSVISKEVHKLETELAKARCESTLWFNLNRLPAEVKEMVHERLKDVEGAAIQLKTLEAIWYSLRIQAVENKMEQLAQASLQTILAGMSEEARSNVSIGLDKVEKSVGNPLAYCKLKHLDNRSYSPEIRAALAAASYNSVIDRIGFPDFTPGSGRY